MSDNSHSTVRAAVRKRPRQERSRALVERILDAAARIFDERGYRATTTNHVAAAAGVSIGSLYQYFPNKDALLVALAERHLAEALPRLAETATRLRTTRPDVETLCRELVTEVADLNRSDRLQRILWTAPRTPDLVETFEQLLDAVAVEVGWHLERLGHPADRVDLRSRVLVHAVTAGIHEIDPDGRIDDLTDELVRLCVRTAAVGPSADRGG